MFRTAFWSTLSISFISFRLTCTYTRTHAHAIQLLLCSLSRGEDNDVITIWHVWFKWERDRREKRSVVSCVCMCVSTSIIASFSFLSFLLLQFLSFSPEMRVKFNCCYLQSVPCMFVYAKSVWIVISSTSDCRSSLFRLHATSFSLLAHRYGLFTK